MAIGGLDYAATSYPDAMTSVFGPVTFALFLATGIALNALVVDLLLATQGVPLLLATSAAGPTVGGSSIGQSALSACGQRCSWRRRRSGCSSVLHVAKGLALFFACAGIACLQRLDARSLARPRT